MSWSDERHALEPRISLKLGQDPTMDLVCELFRVPVRQMDLPGSHRTVTTGCTLVPDDSHDQLFSSSALAPGSD